MIMEYMWKSIIREVDALYGLYEIKPNMEELMLYITDLGPFRHSAGRNKLLLLLLSQQVVKLRSR